MASGFLFRPALFWPKNDGCFLLDVHLKKCTTQFFSAHFYKFRLPLYWGALGLTTIRIQLIECKRNFVRLDTLAFSMKIFSNNLQRFFINIKEYLFFI